MEEIHVQRKRREKEEIRKQILTAALNIAITESWQAVTIRKIAESVQYTTSIVYGHFESKEALFLEIIDNGFKQLYHGFEKAISGTGSPSEKLQKISLINWEFAVQNKDLYQLMFNMERPSAKNAMPGLTMLRDVFHQLTGRESSIVDSFILNWICLRQGCINTMLNFDGKETRSIGKKPKELYMEFMDRFISSIIAP